MEFLVGCVTNLWSENHPAKQAKQARSMLDGEEIDDEWLCLAKAVEDTLNNVESQDPAHLLQLLRRMWQTMQSWHCQRQNLREGVEKEALEAALHVDPPEHEIQDEVKFQSDSTDASSSFEAETAKAVEVPFAEFEEKSLMQGAFSQLWSLTLSFWSPSGLEEKPTKFNAFHWVWQGPKQQLILEFLDVESILHLHAAQREDQEVFWKHLDEKAFSGGRTVCSNPSEQKIWDSFRCLLISKGCPKSAIKNVKNWESHGGLQILWDLAFNASPELRAIGAKKMWALLESFGDSNSERSSHERFVYNLIERGRWVDAEWTIYMKYLVHRTVAHPLFPTGPESMLDRVDDLLKVSENPLADYPLLVPSIHWYLKRRVPDSAKAQHVWSYLEQGFSKVRF